VRKDIDASRLDFRIGPSQEVLPTLRSDAVDLALIDGQHAFPIFFLDWYFCDRWLWVGGVIVVDDTQLWTGHVLRDFLAAESGWRRVHDFFGRSARCSRSSPTRPRPDGGGSAVCVLGRSRRSQWGEAIRRWWVAAGRIRYRFNGKALMSVAAQRVTDADQ
jgi:hypothetical protein